MTNKVSCFSCNKQYVNHQALSCVLCKNYFEGSCVGMGNSENHMMNSKSIAWNCPDCENLDGDIASLIAVIVSLQVDIQQLISV